MFYIGIDDTDNLESRGTGFRARQLVDLLHERAMGSVHAATRHQLLVDPRIPYTSHNSSACVAVNGDCAAESLFGLCREFLLQIAAPGSDAGLCVVDEAQARLATAFGHQAKTAVLTQEAARELATCHGIRLEGLTGTHGGIIGALAAVGLHIDGDDGRYLWVRGLRDQSHRLLSLAELFDLTGTDRVETQDGAEVADPRSLIDLGPWPRTVRMRGRAVLLVEKTGDNQYKVLDKNLIKSIRP
jgi:hypothetical protein